MKSSKMSHEVTPREGRMSVKTVSLVAVVPGELRVKFNIWKINVSTSRALWR